MAAIPIQGHPRGYGHRDNEPLPSLSGRDHGFPNRPFGQMSSHFNNHDILSPASGSVPMAIRGSDNYASLAPPPLPPPRLPPIDSPVDHDVHMKERMRERHLRKEDVGSPDSALGMSGSSGRPSWLSRAKNEYDEGYQSPDSYSSHRFV